MSVGACTGRFSIRGRQKPQCPTECPVYPLKVTRCTLEGGEKGGGGGGVDRVRMFGAMLVYEGVCIYI